MHSGVAAPTVQSTTPTPSSTVSTLTSISITFSEAVAGLSATDLEINNVGASTVSGSGAGPYVFSFTQPPPGPVAVAWSTEHGITGVGTGLFVPTGSWSYTLSDILAPTIAKVITSVAGQDQDALLPRANATVGTLTQVQVNFSEPVQGVDASDLLVNGVPASGVTGAVQGPYLFTFAQPAAGTVTFQWAAGHGIKDLAPTPNNFVANSWSVTLSASGAGNLVINEFMAANATGLRDENGDHEGWIEIYNPGPNAVNLLGWALTNSQSDPAQWVFPSKTLSANGYLVLHASGKDRKPTSSAPSAINISSTTIGNPPAINTATAHGLSVGDAVRIAGVTGGSPSINGDYVVSAVPTTTSFQVELNLTAAGSGGTIQAIRNVMHTNFSLNASGDYLALMTPNGPSAVASVYDQDASPSTTYPSQRYDYSYGPQTGGGLRYFKPSTPGVANGTSTITNIAPKPNFSVGRGTFQDPFQLVLTCSDATATIRYTLNGGEPLATSTAYTGPLTISATSVVRAAAFASNKVPSETVTHSYIFLDNVFNIGYPPYNNPGDPNNNPNYPNPPSFGGTQLPVAWGSRTVTNGAFPGQIPNLNPGQVPAVYGLSSAVTGDVTKRDDNGVTNAAGKTNVERVKQGLRELPVISLVTSVPDMFSDQATGLFPTSGIDESDRTKPASLEMLNPDGTTTFATTCGVDIHGNSSRSPANCPKHGFTIRFKGAFGAGKLEAKLFGDSPVKDFNKIVLRADFNSSMAHHNGSTQPAVSSSYTKGQRARATRTRDAWCKDTFRDMGRTAAHNAYAHLFIDGIYWGVYDATEPEDDDFGAHYYGGNRADYVVYEQQAVGTTPQSGTDTIFSGDSVVPFTRIAGTTGQGGLGSASSNAIYEQYKRYLDVPEFIDYLVLHFYVGHMDWGNSTANWFCIRNAKIGGKFEFLPWDMENLLWGNGNTVAEEDDRTGQVAPGNLHASLKVNSQYLLDFADHVHKHMVASDGALLPASSIARWNKWKAVMNANQMACETSRWGAYRRDVHRFNTSAAVQALDWVNGAPPLYTWHEFWINETNRLLTDYFPVRTNNVMKQLRTASLYPMLNAPQIRDNGTSVVVASQRVTAGFQVKFTNLSAPLPTNKAGISTTVASTLYYTTDGNDPRVYYTGAIASTATLYTVGSSSPITINSTKTIKVRAREADGTWSALNEATFTVGFNPSPVRITEIMYRPPTANGGDAAEFVELQNTGTDDVSLSGYYFDGIDFIFPNGYILQAGARIVLANNNDPAVFAAQYPGVAVLNYFAGSLDNSGERLALIQPGGSAATSVDYGVAAPWPTLPNGGGYSLEIIDSIGDPDDPSNWKASAVLKGTPGQPNSTPSIPSVEISEVLAKNINAVSNSGTHPDYVELHNTSGSVSASIGGWTLATTNNYLMPGGTTIPANGYLIVYCDSAATPGLHTGGAGLPDSGGTIQLKNGTVVIDSVRYGNQVSDKSIGRVSGQWTLVVPSPDAVNVAAETGAITSTAINEWYANHLPGESDWIELYNKSATLPVALKGLCVQTTTPTAPTTTQLYQVAALAFIEPNGWLQLFCDEKAGVDQLDLKLSSSGLTLSLLDGNGASFDAVTFTAQTQGVSQGRLPDGTGSATSFTGSASPGAMNYVISYTGATFNEVLARNVSSGGPPWGGQADWLELYNPSGSSSNMAGMRIGATNNFATAWPIPAGTAVAANGYLGIWCDATQPASTTSSANLNTGFTLGDFGGDLYLFTSAGQLAAQIRWGFQINDRSIGLSSGTWKLLASPTRAAANAAAATLGVVTQLRINEWAASLPGQSDWFELYNLDANPVAMAGLYLTDDPSEVGRTQFAIPALSFIGGASSANAWVKWEADGDVELGRNHVNFTIDGSGEYLRLSNNDASLTLIDAVTFGLQSNTTTQGRVLDGQTVQTGLTPTPGSRNILLPAPSISQQPSDIGVAQGGTAVFSVIASGSAPLSYQWRRSGTPLSGQTGATLSINGVTSGLDGAMYDVVVTNSAGTVTSNVAGLFVQTTYSQWSTAKGLSGSDADASFDFDNDGLTNLQEWFFNLNPSQPSTAAERAILPVVDREPASGTIQYLTLTFRRNFRAVVSNIEFQAGASPDSASWSTAVPDVVERVGYDVATGDPIMRLKFAVAAGSSNKFLRIKLTQ